MNKRIQELAEQAGHTPLEPRTFADDLNEIFLQKFAQLIIGECAEQVKNLRVNDYGISGADIIKEHFGVEE